jgi:cysteine desulfurase / selenocysteine lyase
MSTSDPRTLTPDLGGSAAAPAGEAAALGLGLPDTTQLTALANQFFRGGMQALEAASEGPGQAFGPLGSPLSSAATFSPPTGAERVLRPVALDSGPQLPGSPPYGPTFSSSELRRLQHHESLVSGLPGAPAVPLSTPAAAPAAADASGGLYFLQYAQQASALRAASETRVPGFDAPVPGLPGTIAPIGAPASFASPEPARFPTPAYPELGGGRAFDAHALRRDFPILAERVNGKPLIWLDNAATTQKPQSVIDRISHFYAHENSNVHRGAHTLAARSTDAYEAARDKTRRFLNAPSTSQIVFTRGTTEAINLVAQSWGRRNLRAGDEIILTWLEHHSNIVPWQLLCTELGAKLRIAPVDDSGQVLLDEYEKLFTARTRLASITHVSNALGTITPVKEMVEIAHRHGARILVDGAQAVSHMRVDVQALDCDFYVFSGHKVFGPTGIGALYGKSDMLDAMPPWQGGGNMIVDVTFEKSIFQPAPMRFEAGTGNIADAVGLGAALDYVERVGMENIARYEHELLQYGTAKLREVPRLRLIGTAKEKASVMSFVIDGLTSEQVGQALAREGIAVRAGHHCAQPALRRYGLESTVRPSLAFYNTCEDIDALVKTLKELQSSWLV